VYRVYSIDGHHLKFEDHEGWSWADATVVFCWYTEFVSLDDWLIMDYLKNYAVSAFVT
jgi:hypothetical protein